MDELCSGCPCCSHQPTSGFSAQAVPINDFPSLFLSWRSICFPLHRNQQSVRGFLSVLSNSRPQRGSGTGPLKGCTCSCPAGLFTEWDGLEPPEANTGTFYSSLWSQGHQFTEERRVGYWWFQLVSKRPQRPHPLQTSAHLTETPYLCSMSLAL